MQRKLGEMTRQFSIITDAAYGDEVQVAGQVLGEITLSRSQFNAINEKAQMYSELIRTSTKHGVEDFIHEYNLNTKEGIAIMCLAEALLRIPDKKTATALIEDKIKNKDWYNHIGNSSSVFVNSSTWGLFLTGKIIKFHDSDFSFSQLIAKLGESLILPAVRSAIKLISNEFIMGENIDTALKNSDVYRKEGYSFSYDILGEGARNATQASYYYDEYINAIEKIKKSAKHSSIFDNAGISIKLSALHPRFELLQIDQVKAELLPKVIELVRRCAKSNIAISFDAEESSRTDVYVQLLTTLIANEEFRDYHGIGFVIQAYQKRALHIVDLAITLAELYAKKIPIRLVKGAYWDYEIKKAQELGLQEYPVYTCKEFTDVSYIACAQKMLNSQDLIYSQFATHNAHTIAVIQELATMLGATGYEFQKLHGMGSALYSKLVHEHAKCRIYSPVGAYKDLLAYLMRRLIENGANSSFIKMIRDKSIDLSEVIKCPIESSYQRIAEGPFNIPRPHQIFGHTRKNASGYDLGVAADVIEIHNKLDECYVMYADRIAAKSIIGGQYIEGGSLSTITMPATLEAIGSYTHVNPEQMVCALELAHNYFKTWSMMNVEARADIIERFGNLLHQNRFKFYSILIKEAGKNIKDCIAEVREAIDFARYYALQARKMMRESRVMPGYTGEDSRLSLHGRGVFVCISPWNFPLAIFCGQILAALMTGNTVLAKPAIHTPIIAYMAVQLMHEAGIPKDALHLLLCDGKKLSDALFKDQRISGVCFTGSNEVANSINRNLANRDGAIAQFIAETGGQNAMIIDSSALLEQASDSIINSAFGSAGQRCSALRVLYIQEDIYDDLLNMIIGAMQELRIGNTEKFEYDIGPVISASAKKELEQHVEAMRTTGFNIAAVHDAAQNLKKENGHFFPPHIIEINHISDINKEHFGPILHVRKFSSKQLDMIIDEINSTDYGLTFGVNSRIESKIEYITSRINAGNIYINRDTIGAQVETHPFGGEKKSGTGFKAGGPYYLLKFISERTITNNIAAIGGDMALLGKV